MTLPKILAKFSAKSRPVARNIWKKAKMVSEIPEPRRNRAKNILERWYKCAETWHKEGGRTPYERLMGGIKQGEERVALRQHPL